MESQSEKDQCTELPNTCIESETETTRVNKEASFDDEEGTKEIVVESLEQQQKENIDIERDTQTSSEIVENKDANINNVEEGNKEETPTIDTDTDAEVVQEEQQQDIVDETTKEEKVPDNEDQTTTNLVSFENKNEEQQ